MKRQKSILKSTLLGLPVLLSAMAASAMMCGSVANAGDSDGLPAVKQQGAVRYRSGGVGIDEARAMQADSAHFPLALVFVVRIGTREHYTAAVDVTVAGPDSSTVIETRADGPFLLVDVPQGTYRVSAISGSEKKTRSVRVVAGRHQRVVFAWSEQKQGQGE